MRACATFAEIPPHACPIPDLCIHNVACIRCGAGCHYDPRVPTFPGEIVSCGACMVHVLVTTVPN